MRNKTRLIKELFARCSDLNQNRINKKTKTRADQTIIRSPVLLEEKACKRKCNRNDQTRINLINQLFAEQSYSYVSLIQDQADQTIVCKWDKIRLIKQLLARCCDPTRNRKISKKKPGYSNNYSVASITRIKYKAKSNRSNNYLFASPMPLESE